MSVPAQILQGIAGAGAAGYETLASAGAGSAAVEFSQVYEQSPIYLLNGIASQVSGGIMALANPQLLPSGFAWFRPVAGASLLRNRCAEYPMANQAIAGNAMIAMPVTVSMEMICPASQATVAYGNKNAIITALVASLKQHNATGGLYGVYTPAFTYQNGVMLDFRDVTTADMKQVQAVFQLDFFFPLITVADAQAAQGALYRTITSGAAMNGQPSFSTGATNPSLPSGALTPPTIQ
jgi:hypothetical protein